MNTQKQTGTLYIVATPIGNLEDITLRALRILKEADCIAAEDTRHTQKLLTHYGIKAKLISYYREKEQQRANGIIELLTAGQTVALVTDAGTPAISDPGAIIVARCLEQGLPVVPIPGASAFATALSCAGIHDGSYTFYGFIPAKPGQRRKFLQGLQFSGQHCIFYESPHRIRAFLQDAFAVLGDRKIFIGRELTKSYEDIRLTSLATLNESPDLIPEKGEFVLIISPQKSDSSEPIDIKEKILWYRQNSELSMNACSKAIAAETGLPKSEIYKVALQIWEKESND